MVTSKPSAFGGPDLPLTGPFQIGNVKIRNNLILAPMAGVTDGPFRLICSGLGAGLTVSELVSSKGIQLGNPQSIEPLNFSDQPRPYSIQIFGSDPKIMGEAASYVESLGICDIIDINMGCPVSKVVKTGSGAALMKNPDLAQRIIEQVKISVSLPVTVKFRLGWSQSNINCRDFARMAVDAGVSAIAVHARTKDAGYSGTAKWEYLENFKEICGPIPFIANGDISSFSDLKKLRDISGCDAFMIGRGAIGKPWIFSELSGKSPILPAMDGQYPKSAMDGAFFEGVPAMDGQYPKSATHGAVWEGVTGTDIFGIFKWHLIEVLMEHGEKGVPLFRVHAFAYLRNHPNAASMRRQLCFERDPVMVLKTGEKFFLGKN